MTLEEFERGGLKCKSSKCDSDEFEFERHHVHWGVIHCKKCGAWRDWIKRPREDKPTQIRAPAANFGLSSSNNEVGKLAHPATLEERVKALEHDLAVIAQIVVGKRDA